MLCPACENESKNTQQCTNCGWQFVYFTQEPSVQEQNEYTLLLQNYRTEFWFNIAQQYYQNKQYEEAIQSCFISCEHQMYENPLALLALTYKELDNIEEALKYANMSLEINSNNKMAKQVLDELNMSSNQQDKIIKLTPEILEKDMFETSDEYKARIKNLNIVTIGTVSLLNYDINSETFNIECKIYENISWRLKQYSLFSNIEEFAKKVKIPRDKAKIIHHIGREHNLNAKIEILDTQPDIVDILVDRYSFFNEYDKERQNAADFEKQLEEEEERQSKEQEQKKAARFKKQQEEYEKLMKSLNEVHKIDGFATKIGKSIKSFIKNRI